MSSQSTPTRWVSTGTTQAATSAPRSHNGRRPRGSAAGARTSVAGAACVDIGRDRSTGAGASHSPRLGSCRCRCRSRPVSAVEARVGAARPSRSVRRAARVLCRSTPPHRRVRRPPDPRTGACMPSPSVEVTVLLPCLNEAETLAVCVQKAVRCLAELGVDGEVLVSDNGSTDGSQQIAERQRRPGRGRADPRVRRRPAGRHRGRPRPLRDHGRLRRLVRPVEPRAVHRAAPRGQRRRHGQPVQGRHRPRRHAVPAQVPGQPGAVADRTGALRPQAGRRLPLRHPRLQPGPHPGARAVHAGHGVRLRAGRAGRARRVHAGRGARPPCVPTAAAARRTCAPGATAGGTCGSCSCSRRARSWSGPAPSSAVSALVGTAALASAPIPIGGGDARRQRADLRLPAA